MSKKNVLLKLGTYVNERLPLFVGIGLIIGIHVVWNRIQQVPYFVPEKDRKELPLIIGAKYLKKKVSDEIASISNPRNVDEGGTK